MKDKLKKWIRGIIFVFTFMALFVSSMAALTYYHENAHQQVYARYGIESVIHYGFLGLEGQTIMASKDWGKCNDECNNYQMMIEIVGYHLAAFIITLWFLLLAVLIWFSFQKYLKEKGKKK